MNKEEKEILVKGYWFKIGNISSRIGKLDNAKNLKDNLIIIIKYLDRIIELEEENGQKRNI